MILQVVDEKTGCESVFINKDLTSMSEIDTSIKYGTWKHSSLLSDLECEYAWVWSGGKTLEECCPENLKDQFEIMNQKLRAHMRSIKAARVCLDTNCFFDLIPENLMREYFLVKEEICKSVFRQAKPENYELLKNVHVMLEEVSNQELNLDPTSLYPLRHKTRVREFLSRLERVEKRVDLNVFGSRTGRLTTKKGTFPVLNLNKEYRSVLKPNNDVFVELDFNSAEIRTFLALLGKRDIKEDIHEWNVTHVAKGSLTREQMKEKFFAWLYNPESNDPDLERLYNRKELKNKFWNGHLIKNPFGRVVQSDEKHCINYLIQSTTNDIVLENTFKIREMLKGKRSNIAFTLHDSVIVDFDKDDKHLLVPMMKMFEKTRLGIFKTNIKIGKDFGDMRDIKVA